MNLQKPAHIHICKFHAFDAACDTMYVKKKSKIQKFTNKKPSTATQTKPKTKKYKTEQKMAYLIQLLLLLFLVLVEPVPT